MDDVGRQREPCMGSANAAPPRDFGHAVLELGQDTFKLRSLIPKWADGENQARLVDALLRFS